MRPSALIVFVDPQQSDLDQLQTDLRSVREQLIGMTIDLDELNLAIANVEREYQSRLSKAYRELEEAQLSTQEFQLRLRLAKEGVTTDAIEQRVVNCFKNRWEHLAKQYSTRSKSSHTRDTSIPRLPLNDIQKEQLQQIYHQLAKSFHPDKVSDSSSDTEMMVRINRAYETYDLKTLRRIKEGATTLNSIDDLESISDQKRRLKESIRQTKRFIKELTIEIARVKASEEYRLKVIFDDCQKNGRDLFADLIKDVHRKINRTKHHLKELRQKFNQLWPIKSG